MVVLNPGELDVSPDDIASTMQKLFSVVVQQLVSEHQKEWYDLICRVLSNLLPCMEGFIALFTPYRSLENKANSVLPPGINEVF